ncbi:DUF2267 domain-containing protein [Streptomyces sp. NPDC058252]|uniref:DUF2267 domain-containing protein n=1 Tax=Streptomyces sp. NPDC058252 TaxID=3346405 RepID=UPI0036E46754
MDEKEFLRTVAERTGLSRQEAADLTWATLETLTHRLSPGEAKDLITELPEGLAEAVRRGTKDHIERFGLHDSVRRVAERTMLKEEEADRGVRTVLAVLREAISEKEFNDLMSQRHVGRATAAAARTLRVRRGGTARWVTPANRWYLAAAMA